MNCIVLARTVNTLIRTRVKRWHFLQGARRALWTQITAIKSSGMDTNWDSTLQKLSIPPFLWKPGMGKQRSTGQAPSSPAFKIGPEGYVFYIVLHLDVACPKFCIFKNLKEMINFWIYGTSRREIADAINPNLDHILLDLIGSPLWNRQAEPGKWSY